MAGSESITLRKSILRLMTVYYLAESAVFFTIAVVYAFPLGFFCLFLAVQITLDAIVCLFLILKQKFFYLVKTGKPLSSVNLASKITLFRITMIPSVLFLIIALRTYPVGPVLALFIGLTCLSDLFDGYISRRRGEETFIGKILDSSSDYLLLGVVAIAYYFYRLLPAWLFWLILSRLLLHSLGMMVLFLLRRKLVPQTTIFGKIAVAATMVLFVYKPAAVIFPLMKSGTAFVEICSGVLIALSLVDKGIYLTRGIALNLAERQNRFPK